MPRQKKPLKIAVPFSVPSFSGGSLGAGDFIKNITSSFGISPCSGCQRRAALLNSLLEFEFPAHKPQRRHETVKLRVAKNRHDSREPSSTNARNSL